MSLLLYREHGKCSVNCCVEELHNRKPVMPIHNIKKATSWRRVLCSGVKL